MVDQKTVALTFFLLIFSFSGVAVSIEDLSLSGNDDYDGSGVTLPYIAGAEYGSTVDVELVTSSTPDKIEVTCGGGVVYAQNNNFAGATIFNFDFTIPSQGDPCNSPGSNIYKVKVESSTGSDSVDALVSLNSKGSMSAHSGKDLIVNYDEDNGFYAFQLTNDADSIVTNFNDGSTPIVGGGPGRILVQQYDGSLGGSTEKTVFFSGIGNKTSEGGSLKGLVKESDYYLKCGSIASEDLGTCDVIDQDFLNTFYRVETSTIWNYELDTITPVYEGKSYIPDGQIIYGEEPEYANSQGLGKRFFICRSGAQYENSNGDNVPAVVDVGKDSQELRKCSPSEEVWDNTNECNDGLDNDGDGLIDDNDPSCNTGDTESDEPGNSGCSTPKVYEKTVYEPQFGEYVGIDEYYAEYESGGDCVKTDYTDWNYVASDGTPGTPQEYTCQPDDTGPDCSSISDYDGYSTYDTGFNTYIGDMPVVKYGAHPQYFEQLAEAKGVDIQTEGVSTDFVEQGTGWTTQTQSLYTAERKYDANLIGGGTPDPNSCDQCQSYDWWDEVNVTNIGGYQESITDNHIDAWNTYNAGANISGEIDSGYGSPFQGGFGGDCSDDTTVGWADSTTFSNFDNQLWECVGESLPPSPLSSSASSSDTVVKVPGVEASVLLPDTEINGGSREIGLVLMPYLHMDSAPSYLPSNIDTYNELMQGTTYDGDNIESMDVECWAGSSADQPDSCTNSQSCFYRQDVPVSSTDTYGVSSEVQASDVSNYACAWQYNTQQRSDPMVGSGVIELHKNIDQGDSYNGFWNSLTSEHNGLKEEMTASELQNIVN